MENNFNRISVPSTKISSKKFNLEIASELGMANFESIDNGNLQSNDNKIIGGLMTKRSLNFKEELDNK